MAKPFNLVWMFTAGWMLAVVTAGVTVLVDGPSTRALRYARRVAWPVPTASAASSH